jgi:hypothetical protein
MNGGTVIQGRIQGYRSGERWGAGHFTLKFILNFTDFLPLAPPLDPRMIFHCDLLPNDPSLSTGVKIIPLLKTFPSLSVIRMSNVI